MKKNLIVSILATLLFSNLLFADSIAIIGGGAAGLVSTWLLEQDHDVTLYEANDRLGGHAHSIKVEVDGQKVIIEAGAEFFNKPSYPHFLKLLKHFKIALNTLR